MRAVSKVATEIELCPVAGTDERLLAEIEVQDATHVGADTREPPKPAALIDQEALERAFVKWPDGAISHLRDVRYREPPAVLSHERHPGSHRRRRGMCSSVEAKAGSETCGQRSKTRQQRPSAGDSTWSGQDPLPEPCPESAMRCLSSGTAKQLCHAEHVVLLWAKLPRFRAWRSIGQEFLDSSLQARLILHVHDLYNYCQRIRTVTGERSKLS